MPYVCCSEIPDIDYLAQYSQPSTYHHSIGTCVTFSEYDINFDGPKGLWSAIYYNDRKLQEKYIARFKGVHIFFAPDYSKCGDMPEIENQYRQFRARIVSIWLSENLDAIVIPLISCANERGFKYMLDGMQDCNIVAFNAKGPMGDPDQLQIFCKAIEYTVDSLRNLKEIVVYSASPNIEKVRKLFKYAIDRGIKVRVPNNMLQTRNRLRERSKDGINA